MLACLYQGEAGLSSEGYVRALRSRGRPIQGSGWQTWTESRHDLEKNLGALPERVRQQITCDNVVDLYQLG